MKRKLLKLLVFWQGFPACGLLLNDLSKKINCDILVYATKPLVPFKNLSTYTNFKIKYISDSSKILEDWDMIKDRNCFIFTGWTHRPLLELSVRLKKRNPDTVSIMTVDNRLKFTLRQIIGSIYFRLFLKNKIDYVLVPGFSTKLLMRFFGMKNNQIYRGYYGASTVIYKNTNPLFERENYFIFVGSLDKRKSFDILLASFKSYKKEGGTWGLKVIGDGPLKHLINNDEIDYKGFLQPKETAYQMNLCKVLILPSKDDNWGTVLCEAAACGNLLIASKNVGASNDIIIHGTNGRILDKVNIQSLKKEMFWCENLSTTSLNFGHNTSVSIASNYTEKNYANSVIDMFNND